MHDFAIAVFVKTLKFSPIKTRLAKSTNQEFSDEFYFRSVEITREVISYVQKDFPNVTPYWAVAEKNGLSSGLWSGFEKIWQGDDENLGDRLFQVYNYLIKRHRFVILIGADSPLIHIDQFTETFKNLESGINFVLGPAYDGGFYLLGGSIEIPKSIWKSVRYSSSTTKFQLKALLQDIGSIKELDPTWDIDTEDDIFSMLKTVNLNESLLPCQASIIRWMSVYSHSVSLRNLGI